MKILNPNFFLTLCLGMFQQTHQSPASFQSLVPYRIVKSFENFGQKINLRESDQFTVSSWIKTNISQTEGQNFTFSVSKHALNSQMPLVNVTFSPRARKVEVFLVLEKKLKLQSLLNQKFEISEWFFVSLQIDSKNQKLGIYLFQNQEVLSQQIDLIWGRDQMKELYWSFEYQSFSVELEKMFEVDTFVQKPQNLLFYPEKLKHQVLIFEDFNKYLHNNLSLKNSYVIGGKDLIGYFYFDQSFLNDRGFESLTFQLGLTSKINEESVVMELKDHQGTQLEIVLTQEYFVRIIIRQGNFTKEFGHFLGRLETNMQMTVKLIKKQDQVLLEIVSTNSFHSFDTKPMDFSKFDVYVLNKKNPESPLLDYFSFSQNYELLNYLAGQRDSCSTFTETFDECLICKQGFYLNTLGTCSGNCVKPFNLFCLDDFEGTQFYDGLQIAAKREAKMKSVILWIFVVLLGIGLSFIFLLYVIMDSKSFKFHKFLNFSFQIEIFGLIVSNSGKYSDFFRDLGMLKVLTRESFLLGLLINYVIIMTVFVLYQATKRILEKVVERNHGEGVLVGRILGFMKASFINKIFFVVLVILTPLESYFICKEVLSVDVATKIFYSFLLLKTILLLIFVIKTTHQKFIFLINKKFQRKYGFVYQGLKIYTHHEPSFCLYYLLYYNSLAACFTFCNSHELLFILVSSSIQLLYHMFILLRKYPEQSFWVYEQFVSDLIFKTMFLFFGLVIFQDNIIFSQILVVLLGLLVLVSFICFLKTERPYKTIKVQESDELEDKEMNVLIPLRKTIQQTNNPFDTFLKKKRISDKKEDSYENTNSKGDESVQFSDFTQKKLYGKNEYEASQFQKTKYGKLGQLNEITSNKFSVDRSEQKLGQSLSSSYSYSSFDSQLESIDYKQL